MHVEDHPIEYGSFEGVIPEGYGAGIVMLWDQGTWKPESPDVDAALRKGDLKFTLDGYKLKGSWVLVRTGGRWGPSSGSGEARSWLLIKHRDEWSGELDITEFAPKSVKSEGEFEDILAADRPDVWISNKAAAPARGGEAGAMLAKIIERAAALKAGEAPAAGASGRREAPQSGARERQARRGRAPRAQAPAAGASGRREAPQSGARERQARGGGAPRAQKKPAESSARPRRSVPRKSTKRKTSAKKRQP
jgi:bifunctional non-homologous end joining protein LigD